MEFITLQVNKTLSSNKITDEFDSKCFPHSQRLLVVRTKISNRATYDISTLSLYQEV